MRRKGVLLWVAWYLCCVWTQCGVLAFETHSRSLLQSVQNWASGTQERCITFQSACENYVLSVAISYGNKKGEFRTQGWMNLRPGERAEPYCWNSNIDKAWVLVSRPNDDIGCVIKPILQGSRESRRFCINADDGSFDVRQKFRRRNPKTYFLEGLDEPLSACRYHSKCYGEEKFQKFATGPRYASRPTLLYCRNN